MSTLRPVEQLPSFFHCNLFKGMSDIDYTLLSRITKVIKLKRGEYLLRQFAEATTAFSLMSGALIIERTCKNGLRQVVDFAHPGNYIGLSGQDEYQYSAYCAKDCLIQSYLKQDLLKLADQVSVLRNNLRQANTVVVNHILDHLYALCQKKAHERLAYLILELSVRQQSMNKSEVELFMNRYDIADYLGLTVETVSRAFTRLRQEKVIAIDSPHKIRILSRDALESMAAAS